LVLFAQAYEALSLIRPRNVEFMNGKQEGTINPIVSFMLEAPAEAREGH